MMMMVMMMTVAAAAAAAAVAVVVDGGGGWCQDNKLQYFELEWTLESCYSWTKGNRKRANLFTPSSSLE